MVLQKWIWINPDIRYSPVYMYVCIIYNVGYLVQNSSNMWLPTWSSKTWPEVGNWMDRPRGERYASLNESTSRIDRMFYGTMVTLIQVLMDTVCHCINHTYTVCVYEVNHYSPHQSHRKGIRMHMHTRMIAPSFPDCQLSWSACQGVGYHKIRENVAGVAPAKGPSRATFCRKDTHCVPVSVLAAAVGMRTQVFRHRRWERMSAGGSGPALGAQGEGESSFVGFGDQVLLLGVSCQKLQWGNVGAWDAWVHEKWWSKTTKSSSWEWLHNLIFIYHLWQIEYFFLLCWYLQEGGI